VNIQLGDPSTSVSHERCLGLSVNEKVKTKSMTRKGTSAEITNRSNYYINALFEIRILNYLPFGQVTYENLVAPTYFYLSE